VARHAGLDRLGQGAPVVLFDELHKFGRWKSFLKGFFDTFADRARIVVTGSSRMDVFRRGGDSLMGRYFLYRMHPFTVAEALTAALPDARSILRPPSRIGPADFAALWEHGGYPEPFVKRDPRFTRRWMDLRFHQLVRQDVRDVAQIHQIAQLEVLANILAAQSSEQLTYSRLARDVQISVDTARRWVDTLCGLHLGFRLRPWFRNVTRSLRKEPKWFLRDWSGITDPGKRVETFVASHLLKAVEGWTDLGLGRFGLHFIRDKDGHEVDFVVTRDEAPWMLVEAKKADERLSPWLEEFQRQTKAPHALQVVLDADYVDADCFSDPGRPLIVPARTFLSQLL
jgi:predicted AAA+ superfamily ATPase